LIHASITFLVTLDPVGTASVFMGLTRGRSVAERHQVARTGVVVAGGVLFVFALGGQQVLSSLGISLAAFRIAGGILLFLIAIDMVVARQSGARSTTSDEETEALTKPDIAVFPLAIPLIAGPGGMASVMLLMARANNTAEQGLVLAVLAAVLALVFVALRFSGALSRLLGVTGSNVVDRVLGILLAALAVQFVLDGLTAVFPPK
jgi:multiple antibiotic resistance protein